MAMYVTNNTAAMNTSRWLSVNTGNMESSLAKLSSGYKINTASDNPAGLVISEKLRAQLDSLGQAVNNNQEASNVIGIAEGAMSEMNSILEKMDELAVHAANSGITSADQVIADQAEMDSSVQTIDRIANTTKYSDTYLLNGSQAISYSANTVVDSTVDNDLLDTKSTKIYQAANTNTTVNISYSGTTDGTTAVATASAKKAYLEATSSTTGADMSGTTITADLAMTVSGSEGSKSYTFGDGQTLGAVAETINNDAETTGVNAQLVFDEVVTGVAQTVTMAAANTYHAAGQISAYELDKNFEQDTSYEITDATISSAAGSVVVGKNTDADGRVYVKFLSSGATGTYELYKDADMTMKVGEGALGTASTEANNSGLSVTLTSDGNQQASDVAILQLGNTTEVASAGGATTTLNGDVNAVTTDVVTTATSIALTGGSISSAYDGYGLWLRYTSVFSTTQLWAESAPGSGIYSTLLANDLNFSYNDTTGVVTASSASLGGTFTAQLAAFGGGGSLSTFDVAFDYNAGAGTTSNTGITSTAFQAGDTGTGSAESASVLTGVRLGQNTDQDGKVYQKTSVNSAGDVTVDLYNDSAMSDESLMASGTMLAADVTNNAVNGIEVYAVTKDGGNSSTGLYGTVNVSLTTAASNAGYLSTAAASTSTSEIWADDLGIRLSATEYGEEGSVSVEMTQGALFTDHNDDQLIDKSNSGSDTGQNATITVNGQEKTVDSDFAVKLASTDLNADLVFDEGELGMTTVAVQGYTEGALASRAGQLDSDNNSFATQTINQTSQTVEDLTGGVQLQTGEGTNYYESTIVSIDSMTADSLGSTTFYDDFNGDGLKEEKELSLDDLQSGGYADLSTDPDKAMKIIKSAIDDVSMARARLGAVQANMLETNINSLNVAIQNITSTEGAIRDTDMSTESTNYTKNQILVQAATSMLAQANTLPQQALSLLQG